MQCMQVRLPFADLIRWGTADPMSVDSKPSDMNQARLVSMTFMAYSATTGVRMPDTDSGACTHAQTHAIVAAQSRNKVHVARLPAAAVLPSDYAGK